MILVGSVLVLAMSEKNDAVIAGILFQ